MAGTSFKIETRGLKKIREVFAQLANPDTRPLMDALGAEGESQTRRRISEEKTAPDGTPWAPWSDEYAKTRHGGQSLLQGESDLLESQSYEVLGDDAVQWGSNLIYAAIQHFGGDEVGINIPARPIYGLSEENQQDMDDIITDWAEDLLH